MLVHLVTASPATSADASVPGHSRTRRLAEAFLRGLRARSPGFSLAELDVFARGHSLDLASRGAAALHAALHRPLTDSETRDLAALDLLVDPVVRCDLLVIATPVWNFGVPWRLKQWMDCVAQPGRTFRYSAQGPRGLLSCRAVILGVVGGQLDERNELCFAQLRATLALMGAEPAGEVIIDALDVDPAKMEAIVREGERRAEALAREDRHGRGQSAHPGHSVDAAP